MFFHIAVRLILLHAPDGQEIELNPREISSIREPREEDRQVHHDINCIVTMTNGKFFGVIENCKDVVEKFEKALE